MREIPPAGTPDAASLPGEDRPALRARLAARLRPGEGGESASVLLGGAVLLLSSGFFGWVVLTAANDPDYFERRLIASMTRDIDPVITGSVTKPDEAAGPNGPIPVPSVVRRTEVQPSDYTIVALFETEAVLAAGDELWRVRVGSVLPGLGAVSAIEAGADGSGLVRTEKAVLRAGR